MVAKKSTLHLSRIWLDTAVFLQEASQQHTATKAIA